MKAIIKKTGEMVDVLGTSNSGHYTEILYPYNRVVKSGKRADIRTIKSDKLNVIKSTSGGIVVK